MPKAAAVLEPSCLQALAASLDSLALALDFARTFRRMLCMRVDRICRALCDHDGESALDAVLSLKISSAMAGALEMEGLCLRLEAQLRLGRVPTAGALAAGSSRLESALDKQLSAAACPPWNYPHARSWKEETRCE